MKNLVIAAALAGSFFLGGCATTGTAPGTATEVVNRVIEVTRLTCSFVPTVSTIANITSAGSLSGVTEIANAICAAVTSRSARLGQRPRVAGVPVYGRFVSR